MTENNVIDLTERFAAGMRDAQSPEGLASNEIFDVMLAKDFSVEQVITTCLLLVNAICVAKPEFVDPVRDVANTVIGREPGEF